MLTLYRRHRATCKHRSRRAKKCFCPIWAQGLLRGEAVRRSLDLTNWEAANKLVHEWEFAGMKEIPPVEEVSARIIADLRSRGLMKETVRKMELIAAELSGMFPGWKISRFTPDDLSRFRERWKVKPSTGRKKLERLRSFFKFAVDRGWIGSNPASPLRPPKESVIERKPYDADELEKIGWAIPLFPAKGIYGEENRERIKAFIAVLRWTGLRIRDVVQLKRSMVEGGFLTIRTHKNGKPVQLPIHPEMKDALSALRSGDYFFWSGYGNPKSCVGDWQRTLHRLGEIAGIHVHAHRWRHTFATELLSKGVPVSEVAAILGNSPLIVEKHYSQWISARQEALNAAVRLTWA
jgi:integrase/recombinase XerD